MKVKVKNDKQQGGEHLEKELYIQNSVFVFFAVSFQLTVFSER